MKFIFSLMFMFTMITCGVAHAGFQGFEDGASIGVFNQIDCVSGVTCTKIKGKFKINAGLSNQITASATTLTIAQCGSTIVGGGAFQLELPEASTVLGCRYTFIVNAVAALTVNPDDADQIVLLTDAAGDAISANAIGESITLEAVSATNWAPVGAEKGTWADVN